VATPARVSEPVLIWRKPYWEEARIARFTVAGVDPADEYMHPPDDDPSFNESMYFNFFDPAAGLGGFFRLGNRPNEGFAEMTACLYLPDGRVGFMFGRPRIEDNGAFDAGGLRFEVREPFASLAVTYDGPLALLTDPLAMKDPKAAFGAAEHVSCSAALDYRGVSPMLDGGGLDGFARGHHEQHVGVRGAVGAGGRTWDVDAFGLRDHSWGPRSWQAPRWYRWLTANAGAGHGLMVSVIATADGAVRSGGVLLEKGSYTPIVDAEIRTETAGDDLYHDRIRCLARTAEREVEVIGTVRSLIPLRHRRDGRMTRISEGLTEYRWDGRTGHGLSEYLDQIEDGRPVGD
jgi:hypothetical protein